MNHPDADRLRGLLDLDRLVHEPARLAILSVLAEVEDAEFRFVQTVTGLTRGNLSSHASKLEDAGYIGVDKSFRARTPVTRYRLTTAGRAALDAYRLKLGAALDPSDTARDLSRPGSGSRPDEKENQP